MSKNGKKATHKSDEYITYRVVLAFIGAAVFLLFMSKLQAAIDTPTTYSNARAACLIIAAVSGVCAIFGMAGYMLSVRRETYRPGRVINGMFLAAAALVVAASALILFKNHILGMQVIYMFIPASAILFLIYSVYPKTLFITSATHIYIAFALYALYRLQEFYYRAFALGTALAACLMALALYYATAKKGGLIKVAGATFVVFDRQVNRRYLLALYGATVPVLGLAYLFGGVVAFYAMLATVLFLICSVIYATVKMM